VTIREHDVDRLSRGQMSVRGSQGDKIGTVSQVDTSDDTGEPTWASIRTGLFGVQGTFIPLRDADLSGDDLRIPFDKDTVKSAPPIDPDGHLTLEQEAERYRHYGVPSGDRSDESGGTGVDGSREDDVQRSTDRHADDTAAMPPSRDSTRDGEHAGAGDVAAGRPIPLGTSPEDCGADPRPDQVEPGERTTRLRRFVVTERVVQSVEEVPDRESST
jgi:hypothetical protein